MIGKRPDRFRKIKVIEAPKAPSSVENFDEYLKAARIKA